MFCYGQAEQLDWKDIVLRNERMRRRLFRSEIMDKDKLTRVIDESLEKMYQLGKENGVELGQFSMQAKYDALKASHDKLANALSSLIFTATKLWDDVKPIKDTEGMTVTHPMISQAKQAIKEAEKL